MTQAPRVAWMDAGRGLAIILVVLLHSEEWLAQIGWGSWFWSMANQLLAGMRMPLFFAISGMLGAGWADRSWRDLLTRKVAFLAWVYLAWQPVDLAASALSYQFTHGQQPWHHWPLVFLARVVFPGSTLWFLWALAVFFVLAKVLHGRSISAQIFGSALVAYVVTCDLFPVINVGWNGVAQYAVFFLVGKLLRDRLERLANYVDGAPTVALAIWFSWLAVAAVVIVAHLQVLPGAGFVVRILGLAAGITAAVALAQTGMVCWIGQRTLPVYVAHKAMIIVLVWLLSLVGTPAVVWVWAPPLLAAQVIAWAIALHGVRHLWWLYAPPGWATGR